MIESLRTMRSSPKTKIESLGVYLPEQVMTTAELIARCRRKPWVDMERITGITERRVAVGEYAADLAVEAARRALALSRYRADEIELLICASISKHHAPHQVFFEPATAVRVQRQIGAVNAQSFDVVNACAGIFTALYILQGYIASGAIRCGMIVSGEQNMPLAETATQEMLTGFDGQLASLTLGDCGAAVVVDGTADEDRGFHQLELVTGAKHNQYCYSRPSSRGPGGVLITKARSFQRKGAEYFPYYLKRVVERSGWTMDEIDFGIPHQVSVRGVKNGVKAVRRIWGEVPDRYINNVATYGNTTTTTHLLVLHDFMLRGAIEPGHKLLFVSGASGIVISHATYTMDDLPTRYRAHWGAARPADQQVNDAT